MKFLVALVLCVVAAQAGHLQGHLGVGSFGSYANHYAAPVAYVPQAAYHVATPVATYAGPVAGYAGKVASYAPVATYAAPIGTSYRVATPVNAYAGPVAAYGHVAAPVASYGSYAAPIVSYSNAAHIAPVAYKKPAYLPYGFIKKH